MPNRIGWSLMWASLFVLAATPALYAREGDRVQVGENITVAEDENAGDVVCIGCSIRMEGTCGDVVAVGGSIVVDGEAKGDAVAIGGTIRLGENASVDGDTISVGGRLFRHPNAAIKGKVTQAGAPVLIAVMLIPLVPIVLIVALIVWLLRRNQRPAPVRA